LSYKIAYFKKNLLLYFLSFGHGLKHVLSSSISVILPFIKDSLSLSGVQIGYLASANSISAGLINFPAGILSDIFKKRVGLIIGFSALILSLGFFLVSIISYDNWVLIGFFSFIMIGAGANLWHPPAFSVLSYRYPQKKAFALGVHLSAASAGNTLGPLLTGIILGGIAFNKIKIDPIEWNELALIMSIISLVLSLMVFIFSSKIYIESSEKINVKLYISKTVESLKKIQVITMVVLHALRQSVHSAFTVYLLIYLKEFLDFSPFKIGFYFSLIGISGILFTPIWGSVSDRIGRLPVITLGMLLTSLFIFLLRFGTDDVSLFILLLLLGCVLFAIIPVIAAAAMDFTVKGTEGTSVSLLFTGGAILGSLSPIVAGYIYDMNGFNSVIVLTSILSLIGAFISLLGWIFFKK